MSTYAVSKWGEIYENNRSRVVKDLAWVPIPNKHDGEKYSRLMMRPDAAEIFAAWILILQVASRCQPRGTLLRSGGTPHDSESLSIKTRVPASWFQKGLPILVEMGWLTMVAACRHDADITLSPSRQDGDEERKKGIEGKEGWVSREVAALPEPLKAIAEHWERWIVWWAQNKNGARPMPPETAMEHMEVLMPLTHAERIESIKNSIAGNYARLYAPKPQNGVNALKPEKARIAY